MAMIHKHVIPLAISDGQYKHLERAVLDKLDVLRRRQMDKTSEFRALEDALYNLSKARKLTAEVESKGKVFRFVETTSEKLAKS